MAKLVSDNFRVVPWTGSQHPTLSHVVNLLKQQNYRPYQWQNTPNYRYLVRSHNYHKFFYVVEGSLEVSFPDENQVVRLKVGDRIDIRPNIRHGIQVGSKGVVCVEVAIARA
jgi:quercetin dioxygenase-like cupin family protein